MADQNEEPIVAQSSEGQLKHSTEHTNLISMLHLNGFNSSSTGTSNCEHPHYHHHAHAQCTPFGCCGSNSMKRRSPSSPASLQDPSGSTTESHSEHRAKKLFREQEDLALHGFSTISFPLSLGTFAATNQNTMPCPVPLPPSLEGFVCDPTTPSSAKTFSRSSSSGDKGVSVSLTKDEGSNSMRLRRMKDCLREMRKWWDEVMLEEEEDEPEGDKVMSKDDCGGDAEEAVSVEWAEKCLSICFKCPCTKGYQILLSGNNCYYKLV